MEEGSSSRFSSWKFRGLVFLRRCLVLPEGGRPLIVLRGDIVLYLVSEGY